MIVPIAYYKRILEELHDLAVIVERYGEKTISFEEVKRQLSAR